VHLKFVPERRGELGECVCVSGLGPGQQPPGLIIGFSHGASRLMVVCRY
jgi:hypothetical protein